MDAVRPEVATAQQHDHPRRPLAGPAKRRRQPPTLRRTHRAVVELETQEPDPGRLLIGDILPGGSRRLPVAVQRQLRQAGRFRKGQGGRQLDAARPFDVADPDRAIDRRPQNCGLPAPDQAAGFAAQGSFGPGIEEMTGFAKQAVSHPGKAIGSVQARQNGGTAIHRPVDDTILLFHQRQRLPRHPLRREVAGDEARDGLFDCDHRCLGDLVAIDRSLASPPHQESRLGPDRTGVHFSFRL